MGLNEAVQDHVKRAYIQMAKQRGESMIRVKAGDVHRDLKWTNRVPSVCTTLSSQKFQRETGLKLVSTEDVPPSGMGTRAVFVYQLPLEHADSQQRKQSRLQALYGTLSDVFRELGGGEDFLRAEREKLYFRKEDKELVDSKGSQ